MKMKFYRSNQSVWLINDDGSRQSLYVLKQGTKGPGNETVKIANLPGSNGRQWLSLNRLRDGEITEIELEEARPKRILGSSLNLTEDEKAEIERLENRIKEIKENARKRQPVKPDLNINVDELSNEELIEYAKMLNQYLKSRR